MLNWLKNWKPKYRIKQLFKYPAIFRDPTDPPTMKKEYIVQRRLLWLFWYQEGLFATKFVDWFTAREYIVAREGIFLHDC